MVVAGSLALRNRRKDSQRAFRNGNPEIQSYDIPVISVGNITVGGTGKTPHTEYLIRLLRKKHKVAVLSRGYKRKSKGFILATSETSMPAIGDEPYQMKQKFPDVYVAVDKNRRRGIERLCDEQIAPGTEVHPVRRRVPTIAM